MHGVSGALVGAAVGCATPRMQSAAPPDGSTTTTDGGTHKTATDRVVLGSTGIVVSRLAMGSGTHGSGGASDQTRLGRTAFTNVLVHGYDQGLTLFETADAYGAHPQVAAAIQQVGRQNVTVLTKTSAQTKAGVEADLARFRTELGVDTIDIVLLHNKQSGNWVSECEGAMMALDLAKQSGAIRAHGVSCHTIQALRLAAQTPWVDVDLARINPAGVIMDSDPATVLGVLRQMKAAGKGVVGMKILGEGQLANDLDTNIGYAVGLNEIDAFTIGFTSNAQMDEVVQKIATV